MTLSEALRKFGKDESITITSKYGVLWQGKAMFVESHLRPQAMRKEVKVSGRIITIL